MMSFFVFAVVLTVAFVAAMSVLTLRALAGERRAEALRQDRVRASLARLQTQPASAAMYALADRRKTVSADVAVERRAA